MVIDKKILFVVTAFATTLCCNANPADGFVRIDSKGVARLYTTHEVARNDEIRTQYPGKNGLAVCCTVARLSQSHPGDGGDVVSDELSEKDIRAYRISFVANNISWQPFIGMAMIGTSFTVKDAGTGLIIQSAGKQSFMRTCFSNEGVHLLRSEGPKMIGHLYLSLGYDVHATCPKNLLDGQ